MNWVGTLCANAHYRASLSLFRPLYDHCAEYRATIVQATVLVLVLIRLPCDRCPGYCATIVQTIIRLWSLIRLPCDHGPDYVQTLVFDQALLRPLSRLSRDRSTLQTYYFGRPNTLVCDPNPSYQSWLGSWTLN